MTRRDKATENYFIGKCLLDNRNKAAIKYLRFSHQGRSIYLRGMDKFCAISFFDLDIVKCKALFFYKILIHYGKC